MPSESANIGRASQKVLRSTDTAMVHFLVMASNCKGMDKVTSSI